MGYRRCRLEYRSRSNSAKLPRSSVSSGPGLLVRGAVRPLAALECRDGKPKLLFARFKTIPDDVPGPVVGLWHKAIERWKVRPDYLDKGDEMLPTHWMEIPELPLHD